MDLFFNPPIREEDWDTVISVLLIKHPNLKWRAGQGIDYYSPFIDGHHDSDSVCHMFIDEDNRLTYTPRGDFFIGDQTVINGWEYLGLDMDTHDIFNNLYESEEKEWFEEIDFNVIPIKKTDRYIVDFTSTNKIPDDIRGRLQSMYNGLRITNNVFNNEWIFEYVNGNLGILLYVEPYYIYDKKLQLDWDEAIPKIINQRLDEGWKIYTLEEFNRLVIVD
jgi:hypothetical protein